MKLYVAKPRGFCAGVHRAIETLNKALQKYDSPLYVRHEIIHNKTVVEDFKSKGVVFVESLDNIPNGAVALFSAHGVSQHVMDKAKERSLTIIDATCPLVTKVHNEAKRFGLQKYYIIMIGHKGHAEVEGTVGHIGHENYTIVETAQDAKNIKIPQAEKLALLTQTTLSIHETKDIIEILQQRFPHISLPAKKDICYATQNRQDAVKTLAPKVEVFIVVGSKNSSNSNRLKETALAHGAKEAFLIDNETELPDDIQKYKTIGLSGGASAPEFLVQDVINTLKAEEIEEVVVAKENMSFQIPAEVRE